MTERHEIIVTRTPIEHSDYDVITVEVNLVDDEGSSSVASMTNSVYRPTPTCDAVAYLIQGAF